MVVVLAVLVFGWRMFDYFVPGIVGSEEHGYLTTAKRLATTGSVTLRQEDPYAFVGETMMQAEGGTGEMYCLRGGWRTMGYSWLCAAAYFVGGPMGPFVVNPICAVAVIIGVYVLGRLLKKERGGWGGLVGAIVAMGVAVCPLFLYYAVRPLPQMAHLAVGVWMMVAAMAWRRDRKVDRAIVVRAVFGGVGAVVAVAAAGAMVWGHWDAISTEQLERVHRTGRGMMEAGKIVQSKASAGAVILADNQSEYFLDYVGRYTIYSAAMFEPERIAQRVSDLARDPHAFDPARTREIKGLVGGKTVEELDAILRQRLRGYLSVGRPVFVFGTQEQASRWKERLKMPMEKVAGSGGLVMYEVEAGN